MSWQGYAPRSLTDLGTFEHEGWRLKASGIRYQGGEPRPELVEAAWAAVAGALPTPATTPKRYGVGFLRVHEGSNACYVYAGWWQSENELILLGFLSPVGGPTRLRPTTDGELVGCVWPG